MSKRLLLAVAALALTALAVPTATYSPAAANTDPAYLTIVAGRGYWEAGVECSAYPDEVSVDLGEVAAEMGARGMAGYATVVGDWTRAGRYCPERGELYASWSDLARLRDTHGWTVGSNGDDRNRMVNAGSTLAEQWQSSCGAYRKLRAHGHHLGWALFAYPGGGNSEDVSDAVQDAVVSRCFGFGRLYTDDAPYLRNRRAEQGDPSQNPHWWQHTHNIYGGRCNDTSLPCSTIDVNNGHFYEDPADLAAYVQAQPGEWNVLQFHAFVSRSRLTGAGDTWDCAHSDWRRHWTSRPGLYCWEDFVKVLDAVPASVTVTDPATVATAWGRVLPAPTVTAVSPATGSVAGGNTVTISGQHLRAVGSQSDGFVAGRGFTVRFGSRAATVLSVTDTAATVRVPRGGSAGRVAVTVVNADGLTAKLAGAYRYAG